MSKILFIEDETALQRAVAEVLGAKGYTVLEALDGESGEKLARDQRPDLILLDLILPRKDGFEVLRTLKSDPNTRPIPVIILSNLEGSLDVERALDLGANAYLVKTNYTLDEVAEKIKNVLGS